MEFIPSFKPLEEKDHKIWLLFSEKEQYIALDSNGSPFLSFQPSQEEAEVLFLGFMDGRNCYCLSYSDQTVLPEGMKWERFMDGFRELSPVEQYPVSRGKMLQEWRRSHRFCGSCGSPTEFSETEHARICTSCGQLFYPKMAPAVIVRITRRDQILLARNSRFPEGLYSNIAGFVDPGETLEQTIHREVYEEVGMKVQNIKFFSSQTWPMPHSLMLAFTAEAVGTADPVPDGVEIMDARWFSRDSLPDIPGPGSISGQLLLDYLSKTDSPSDHR
jgi:NAD+ diphosphatase